MYSHFSKSDRVFLVNVCFRYQFAVMVAGLLREDKARTDALSHFIADTSRARKVRYDI